jgi:hypothetical protein
MKYLILLVDANGQIVVKCKTTRAAALNFFNEIDSVYASEFPQNPNQGKIITTIHNWLGMGSSIEELHIKPGCHDELKQAILNNSNFLPL